MSSTTDKKPGVMSKVLPMMSKITYHKLNGLNYFIWSKTIQIYLKSIRMASHLVKHHPTNDLRERLMEEDARLFLHIRNSIESELLGLINHCEFVKNLLKT